MRGPGREKMTLAGQKGLEKAASKKEKRKVNRQLGRAGYININNPATRNSLTSKPFSKKTRKQLPIISVLFVEHTNVEKNILDYKPMGDNNLWTARLYSL